MGATAMTQIKHDTTYQGPPTCERCGLRHPQPWVHKGEQMCQGCKQALPKYNFEKHDIFCKRCKAEMVAKVISKGAS